MPEEKMDVVEVMARATYAVHPMARYPAHEKMSWEDLPGALQEAKLRNARSALAALEAQGWAVVRKSELVVMARKANFGA